MKALILIDLQVAIFQMPQPLLNADDFLNRAEEIIRVARANKIPLIYLQHNRPNTDLEKGSPKWAFHPRLLPKENDIIVHKTEPDGFVRTDLQGILKKLDIREVYICGLVTEVCIESTLRGAYTRDYKVTLFEDAHTTYGSSFVDAHLAVKYHNFQMKRFATLVKTADAQKCFSK